MNDRICKILWEERLVEGSTSKTAKQYNLSDEEVRLIMEYTMPEMFVDEEFNLKQQKEIRILKRQYAKDKQSIRDYKTSNILYGIGIVMYFIIVFPILSLLIYVLYF